MKRIDYSNQSKMNALLRHYENIYRKNPKSKIFAPLADAYRRQGRVEEALALCVSSLRAHKNFSSGRLVLGKCYFDQRLYDRAIEELSTVVNLNPTNAMAFTYLGKANLAINNYEKALGYFLKVKELAPQNDKVDKIISRLEAILRPFVGQVPDSQASSEILSKRPLYCEETDQYVVRNVKEITKVATPKNISPAQNIEMTKKSLQNLFISQGLQGKASQVAPNTDLPEFKIELSVPKYKLQDDGSIRGSVLKDVKIDSKRIVDLSAIVEEFSNILPIKIKEKNGLNDQESFPEISASLDDTVGEEELVAENNFEGMVLGAQEDMIGAASKNFDGSVPENFDGRTPENFEVRFVKELGMKFLVEKKNIINSGSSKITDIKNISLKKLSGLLERIQERAY